MEESISLRILADALKAQRGAQAASLLEEFLQAPVAAVLLFGSRARGEETESSDIDAVAFVEGPVPSRWSEGVRCSTSAGDLDLDVRSIALVHDERSLEERFYWHPARLLWDRDGLAAPWLERLAERVKSGPSPLPPEEWGRREAWFTRMLRRIASHGHDLPLASYQRAWLLTELLQSVLPRRGHWTRGARATLDWIRDHEPDHYRLWVQALGDGPIPHEVLKELVETALEKGSGGPHQV